jgi:hypothetical protein
MDPRLRELLDDVESGPEGRVMTAPWRRGDELNLAFGGKLYSFAATPAEARQLSAALEKAGVSIEYNAATVDAAGNVLDYGR